MADPASPPRGGTRNKGHAPEESASPGFFPSAGATDPPNGCLAFLPCSRQAHRPEGRHGCNSLSWSDAEACRASGSVRLRWTSHSPRRLSQTYSPRRSDQGRQHTRLARKGCSPLTSQSRLSTERSACFTLLGRGHLASCRRGPCERQSWRGKSVRDELGRREGGRNEK